MQFLNKRIHFSTLNEIYCSFEQFSVKNISNILWGYFREAPKMTKNMYISVLKKAFLLGKKISIQFRHKKLWQQSMPHFSIISKYLQFQNYVHSFWNSLRFHIFLISNQFAWNFLEIFSKARKIQSTFIRMSTDIVKLAKVSQIFRIVKIYKN